MLESMKVESRIVNSGRSTVGAPGSAVSQRDSRMHLHALPHMCHTSHTFSHKPVQLYLHAEAAPAWRRSCMDIVCDLTDSPHFDAEAGARSVDVEGVKDAVKIQVKGLNVTEEGTAHLIKALLGVLG